MLNLYAAIVDLQQEVFDAGGDRSSLVGFRESLVRLIANHRSEPLGRAGEQLDDAGLTTAVEAYWRGEAFGLEAFFARVLLGPYAAGLETKVAAHGTIPTTCPTCGHAPQIGVLRSEGEGSTLSWICSLCARDWPFPGRRCVACSETGENRLAYFTAEEPFAYVRVVACDACKTYVHAIDIEKEIEAEPIVDELAFLPLDVWAQEQGYTKLQSNLAGI